MIAEQGVERFTDLEDGPEKLGREHDGMIARYDYAKGRFVMVDMPEPTVQRVGVASLLGSGGSGNGGSGTSTIAGATDFTDTTGAGTDGYSLVWDQATSKFVLADVDTDTDTTTIADATDFTDTTGPGTDGHLFAWDDDTSKFVLIDPSSVGVTDHGALNGKDDDDHPQYHNDTRGDARYGRLTADNMWTGLNNFDQNPIASWFDVPIINAQGDSFNTSFSGTPTGWTQITSANNSNSTERIGFWYLREAGGGSGYAFSKQTTFDDTDFGSWFSALFGPIMWRDGAYTADADWYFGIHADDTGSASTDDWIRANLNWDSTNSIFRVRGQYSIGGAVTSGSWNDLAFPPPQPLYFRVTGRMDNGESDRQRVYVGTVPISDAQTNILTATSPHGDFDNFHVKIEHVKSSSPESYLYFGGLDFGDDP